MFYQVISLDKRNYINRVRNFQKNDTANLLDYISEQLELGSNFEVVVKKYEGNFPASKSK